MNKVRNLILPENHSPVVPTIHRLYSRTSVFAVMLYLSRHLRPTGYRNCDFCVLAFRCVRINDSFLLTLSAVFVRKMSNLTAAHQKFDRINKR